MEALSRAASARDTITVAICTCDRGARLIPAVRSILAAGGGYRELIVIDQSANLETRDALALFIAQGHVRWIPSATRGSGHSRTIALQAARSEYVAFTDDDCLVEPGWLEAHLDALRQFPGVALSYGAVLAAEYDPALGYIPDYPIQRSKRCVSWRDRMNARGIGANFAVRRQEILDLGGFDPALGAGAPYFSAEDRDLTLRCFAAGLGVYECAESRVVHEGFRGWAQGRRHTQNDWFGLGAVFAKPLRDGQWRMLPYLLHEFTRFALLPFLLALLSPQKKKGFLRIQAFIAGFARGWIGAGRPSITSEDPRLPLEGSFDFPLPRQAAAPREG
ncbi:glycosyl transferase [Capsulimonas corticalis]|uniref:Glycosyl transferase n=1 Tax=Capsulimonas corticalis TaxID=2219043 RepID=A0A402CZZ4_9BACT|nr:glycosyltransferase family A protein [Capsulimonas corticalis]BDI33776.1 glycosyl transferase [Capsulimonas corticalis]